MPTKRELERQIEELTAKCERLERERNAAMMKPGIVRELGRFGGEYITTASVEPTDDMWDEASNCLSSGDFYTEPNEKHAHVTVPVRSDNLPPNVDGFYVEYFYCDEGGLCLDRVFTVKKV